MLSSGRFSIVILSLFFASVVIRCQDEAYSQEIVPSDARVQSLGVVAFVEGPAWSPDGSTYFTDVHNNRIMRYDTTAGTISIWREPAGRANGLVFDTQGRLIACEGAGEGGNRRITRTELDGTITTLTDHYEEKPYNSPNDLTIDASGRIYFTDPRYGPREGMEMKDAQGREIEGVYRIDPAGQVSRIITHEVDRPNGIAVAPDGKTLYVIDNNNSIPAGNRKVWAFSLDESGNIVAGTQRMLHDFGRGRGGDGMALDQAGRLYIAAGFLVPNLPLETADNPPGIYVFSPEGKQLEFIEVPEDMVTNCAFGNLDRKTLFITAGHRLWSVPVIEPGHLIWPPLEK